MDIPDQLRCLFSAVVEEREDSFVIEIPKRELAVGEIQTGETYRVALLSSGRPDDTDDSVAEPQASQLPEQPPVEEGEQRTVEIENLGDQGDGITRVERGFVVIVPDSEPGERVTVKITDVRENVAFAEVQERESYYE